MATIVSITVLLSSLPGAPLVTPEGAGWLIYVIPAEAWGSWFLAASLLSLAGLLAHRLWVVVVGAGMHLLGFALLYVASAMYHASPVWSVFLGAGWLLGGVPIWGAVREVLPAVQGAAEIVVPLLIFCAACVVVRVALEAVI